MSKKSKKLSFLSLPKWNTRHGVISGQTGILVPFTLYEIGEGEGFLVFDSHFDFFISN